MTRIAREIEILLLCARVRMESGQAMRIRELLTDGIDWAYLMRMAGKHRLRPLLYWHLAAECPEAMPAPLLMTLREQFHGNFQRNLRFTHELSGLLRLLEKEGIEAIPFKGPTLTLATLGNLALREFTDLDIHVPEADVTRVNELLQQRGYKRHFQLGRAQEAEYIRHHSEISFHNKEGDILLEVHWRFESRYFSFSLEPSELRCRLQPFVPALQNARVYSPEDQFLLLCAHGTKHLWRRLRWICDLAEMLRVQEKFDWTELLSRAQASGAERMTLLGIRLAHNLLDAPIPEHVLRRVAADPAVQSLAEQVRNQLSAEDDKIPGILEHARFHLKTRERRGDRVRYCFRLAVTPTGPDWKVLSLPAALSPLYYVIRPFRLAAKYCFRGAAPQQR